MRVFLIIGLILSGATACFFYCRRWFSHLWLVLRLSYSILPCLSRAVRVWAFYPPYEAGELERFLEIHYPHELRRVNEEIAAWKRKYGVTKKQVIG